MAPYLFFFLLSFSRLISSTHFTYLGFSDPKLNISLYGVALIQPNRVLRLTNDTGKLLGHAFYPYPIQFQNSTSFSTCFAFSIHSEYPKLGGHGLAFAIAPDKDLKSAVARQYLGLFSGNTSNHIFAVEFDTVLDMEFGDINDNHVGIDLNSLNSNLSSPAAYFDDSSNKIDVNLKGGKPIVAWIDYIILHLVQH